MTSAADIGDNLLAAAAAAIDSPPARRVFTVGAPTDPIEGEQLAVGFSRYFTGEPGAPRPGPQSICNGPLVAEFVVRLLRCFPSSTQQADTPPAAILAATHALLGDADRLRLALRSWEPYEGVSQGDVWVGDVIGYRPQGLAQALQVTVHVAT